MTERSPPPLPALTYRIEPHGQSFLVFLYRGQVVEEIIMGAALSLPDEALEGLDPTTIAMCLDELRDLGYIPQDFQIGQYARSGAQVPDSLRFPLEAKSKNLRNSP